jgi:hypothetical protein
MVESVVTFGGPGVTVGGGVAVFGVEGVGVTTTGVTGSLLITA